jgi:hypothetical protein
MSTVEAGPTVYRPVLETAQNMSNIEGVRQLVGQLIGEATLSLDGLPNPLEMIVAHEVPLGRFEYGDEVGRQAYRDKAVSTYEAVLGISPFAARELPHVSLSGTSLLKRYNGDRLLVMRSNDPRLQQDRDAVLTRTGPVRDQAYKPKLPIGQVSQLGDADTARLTPYLHRIGRQYFRTIALGPVGYRIIFWNQRRGQ